MIHYGGYLLLYESFAFSLIYIFCKKYPNQVFGVIFILRIKAAHFPWFYLFVLATSAFAAALAASGDPVSSGILAAIAVTTIFARQGLMPAINQATDCGAKRRFQVLHTASVLITIAHIIGAGFVILRLAGT